MSNNFGSGQSGSRNQEFGNYFDEQQPYQSDQYCGTYHDNNAGVNQRGSRSNSVPNHGLNNDGYNRGNDRSNRNGQRGRGQRTCTRGRGGPPGDGAGRGGGRTPCGNFAPLPARINWPQQLEEDRQQASLNWAPSFRNAGIQIPPQFYTHTRDEQLVSGQELMDLGVLAFDSSRSTSQQAPLAPPIRPLIDCQALELEADNIAGE